MEYNFVAFEGIDGTGKSTHAKSLADYLTSRGYDVVLTTEPTFSHFGAKIKQLTTQWIFSDPSTYAFLYAADRAEHCYSIRNAMAKNQIVVCDRFSASSFAYQHYAGDVPLDYLEKIDAIATRGLKPDIYIWLDCDIDIARERVEKRGEIFDNKFMRKVQDGYYDYFYSFSSQNVLKINSALSSDRVHEIIKAKLNI